MKLLVRIILFVLTSLFGMGHAYGEGILTKNYIEDSNSE
jgi:hypothetical protein